MKIKKSNKNKVKHVFDELEKKIVENYELLSLPLTHRFTDGLYVREVSVPKGCIVTSKIHKKQHQFFILKGKVLVWDEDGNEQILEAPYLGITQENTRRVVYAIEDFVWATCHPNPENKILSEIENEVFDVDSNELLDNDMLKKIQDAQNVISKNSITIDNIKNNILCQQ
jgi:hypothetical protein